MNRFYQVAGHRFGVSGERLCGVVGSLDGFEHFLVDEGEVLFSFVEGDDAPEMCRALYEFSYEDIIGVFGRHEHGYMLSLKPEGEASLDLWCRAGEKDVMISGNMSGMLVKYALWIGLGLMTAPYDTVAVHSSCIVCQDKAVLFLGESGTGKSTHTRLWQENIEGAFLLNDDSPLLRFEDGKVWAYGSPWSGKTPCYKQERYELKACVRLSQAGHNKITRLEMLEAYGAIHPSCPPAFAYDGPLYDNISSLIGKLLMCVPFYHLECLPDGDAARVAFSAVFDADYQAD